MVPVHLISSREPKVAYANKKFPRHLKLPKNIVLGYYRILYRSEQTRLNISLISVFVPICDVILWLVLRDTIKSYII